MYPLTIMHPFPSNKDEYVACVCVLLGSWIPCVWVHNARIRYVLARSVWAIWECWSWVHYVSMSIWVHCAFAYCMSTLCLTEQLCGHCGCMVMWVRCHACFDILFRHSSINTNIHIFSFFLHIFSYFSSTLWTHRQCNKK